MTNQLPIFERVREEDRPGLRIQKRDLDILETVFKYRFISSSQLKSLLWWIPERTLQSRLKKMYHNKYLNRPVNQRVLRIMNDFNEIIYSLDERGVDLVAEELGIDKRKIRWHCRTSQSNYLRHSLMISRFRVVLTLATETTEQNVEKRLSYWLNKFKAKRGKEPSLTTLNAKRRQLKRLEDERRNDFLHKYYKKGLNADCFLKTWKKGKQLSDSSFIKKDGGSRERFPIAPDGYFELEYESSKKTHHWFLEADRGTMSKNRFQRKLESYQNYKKSRSGRRARRRRGIPNFKVLTVTEDRSRRNQLIETAKNSESIGKSELNSFWFGVETDYSLKDPEKILDRIFLTPTNKEKKSILETIRR